MTYARTKQSRADDARAASPLRKAVLICPECGHESPLDEDWEVKDIGDECRHRRIVSCPVCGTVIADQPYFPDRMDDRASSMPFC